MRRFFAEAGTAQGTPSRPPDAHSPRDDPTGRWEPLGDHLAAVGVAAEGLGAAFGWGAVAGLAGRLHDIGKCSTEFQSYLAGQGASGGDHSGAGAIEVRKLGLAPQLGHALAAVIAGHHAGLADGTDLIERLDRGVPTYPGWRAQTGPLPSSAALAPARMPRLSPEGGFTGAFLTRMLFSCLVDADSVKTARFYGEDGRTAFTPIAALDETQALPPASVLLGRARRVRPQLRNDGRALHRHAAGAAPVRRL